MMVRAVAILAVLGLSACGVGVAGEDPEGQAAVSQQAELQLSCTELGTCPQLPVTAPAPSAPTAAPSVMSAQVPGTVALPQDPIPWRPPTVTAERPFGPNGPDTGLPGR
jgi:hypothetical protein